MATRQRRQDGRLLLYVFAESLVLLTPACVGAPFSDNTDRLDGGVTSSQNGGMNSLDGSAESGATTENTPCGSARADNASKAVDICIAAGQSVMGTTAANLGGSFADHSPPHTVDLSAYFIDAYEVTVARYRACVTSGVCEAPGSAAAGCTFNLQSADALPVNCVTYPGAVTFCNWDGNRRLPTEAEWERAARGASSNNYPWGDTFSCDQAVAAATTTCTNFDPQKPAIVGTLPAGKSIEGAFDLVGNVAEWVSDWVGSYPSTEVTDPSGPTVGTQRVVRGGDWVAPANQTAAYLRRSSLPANAGTLGFRCARSAD